MRSLTRTLPAAALALVLCGCGFLDGGDGPGARTGFVELGPLQAPSRENLRPARLGHGGDTDRMYAALEAAKAANLPQVQEELTVRPSEGDTGLAFVLPGCQNTGARLEVDDGVVSADLTGAENVNCGQAEYFLATFTIGQGELPEDWTFAGSA
ncbi:hypothetical protein G6045_15200 [Streptomyces sp. YC504]|uniref:Lipoprotein n=1 Tax=Streptomyces mesophilus TaxID=1775132 RepID=A0A6G4XHW7_9ACTN|nr:hypothetical protein [Streptomyces mesophilus]NGO76998.1 hypothetical protein [Streptomyces mesophilus]